MLFSIIIPVYNSEKTIEQCINSVLAQTYTSEIEIIIVDDGSSDSSLSICEELAREAQRLHSFPDWFRVHSTKWHGFREVGNSVPPILARNVGAQIMQAMRIIPDVPQERIQLGNDDFLYANTTEAGILLKGTEYNGKGVERAEKSRNVRYNYGVAVL